MRLLAKIATTAQLVWRGTRLVCHQARPVLFGAARGRSLSPPWDLLEGLHGWRRSVVMATPFGLTPGLQRHRSWMPRPAPRPVRAIRNVVHEISHARRLTADVCSSVRWSTDIVAFRMLRVVRWPSRDHRRTITLKGGQRLTYRLNRGDVLTLREVWIDEVYRLPGTASSVPRSLVDLGANIGLTIVWFASAYGCEQIVAVEPLKENVELLRENLAQNDISATVLECAVGPAPGVGFFARAGEPNSGYLAREGLRVNVVSMDGVLRELDPPGSADMVKIDIEGAEQALFAGELEWLAGVQLILVELHPGFVDVPRIVHAIEAAGFERAQALTEVEGAVTSFVRRANAGEAEC